MRWGPTLTAEGTRFRLWAPDAPAVTLQIDGRDDVSMTAVGDGWFEAQAPVGTGRRYRFRIGDLAAPDPASRAQDGGVDG